MLQNYKLKMPVQFDTTKKTEEDEPVSFEDAIEIVGTGFFQYKLVLIGGFITLASYVATGGMTFVLQPAQCDLQMGSSMKGHLASANIFGLIISCHLMGFLSDTLGRRYTLIRCLLLDAAIYLITCLAPSHYTTILILRVFNGIASCGSVVSVIAYIGEFQVPKYRTSAILACSFVVSLFYISVPALAWMIIPIKIHYEIYPGLIFKSWRLFHALTSIPSLLAMILLYYQPESPKFLLAKGRNDEAVLVLRKMYIQNKGNDNFKITKLTINDCEKVAKLGDDANKAVAFLKLMWHQTAPLFKAPYRRNLVLLSAGLCLIYYSNSALYVWMPEVINGIAIVYRETDIVKGTLCDVIRLRNIVNMKNQSMYELNNNHSLIQNITQLTQGSRCREDVDVSVYANYVTLCIIQIFNWIGIMILERVIRKKFVLVAFSLLCISSQVSMLFPYSLRFIPLTATLSLVGSGAVFPVLNSVVVDIFPTNLRAMASCLALMIFRIGTMFGYSITGILIDNHCRILIYTFITASVGCLLTIIFLPMKIDFSEKEKIKEVP